ncbi:TPA: FKBP-type peptidyl-prolyl cis-trans isomerase [archaeon]|uniref:Peptidyl-prolyl cis-trans isomerase n=1 Tax=Candidatus Naiadarchaeum limnaeum TaxID=2756139 RepID=A0A832UVW7_9ARCH|nr:FKBP-type peptidyl-prolyl cis-trans isomerase [Candidatus Naiadarchaeales archaeon SRR2090153.bin1042]HIK00730.1 FKBP-type peptidyl-prolyl cis-trans isomerase [Candidatus Naiadarchaeum limnaeum]
MRKIFVYLVLIALFALIAFYFLLPKAPSPQEGDIVWLTLVGKLENGTIVDNRTNFFVLNSTELLPGIFQEVLTMHENEMREVILPSERAFGKYNFDLLQSVDRISSVDRYQNFSKEEFATLTKEKPEVYKLYILKDIAWHVNITNMTRTTIFIEHKPVLQSLYFDPLSTQWAVRVRGIDPDKIIYTYEPKVGAPTVFGGKPGVVKEMDGFRIIVDLNHPLAGKTITYNIKLWNFTSA